MFKSSDDIYAKRRQMIEQKVNKIWKRYHTPNLKDGALQEFDEYKKHLSPEEQKIAQNCWDKLEDCFFANNGKRD